MIVYNVAYGYGAKTVINLFNGMQWKYETSYEKS